MGETEKTYEGLGPVTLVPRLYRSFDPAAGGLTPEDYYMLTRVDGRTSLRQLVLISGFDEGKAVGHLQKLRAVGAILLRDETVPPPPPKPPAPAPPTLPAVDPADPRLAEAVDLTLEQKTSILAKHMALKTATYFQVLDIAVESDKKAVKAAFRKFSKDFHPDRYYGKRLGSFKALLDEVFNVAKSADEILSDDEQREAYIASLSVPTPVADPPSGRGGGRPPAAAAAAAATPAAASAAAKARAAEIFEAACMDHVAGELKPALEKFAQVVAADPQPRYLRRAAECALKAQELRLAEEYGKKARDMDRRNPASHRIMAKVLRASGRIDEARANLAEALRLDPGNPHILAELRELDEALR